MKKKIVNVLGMTQLEVVHKKCVAYFWFSIKEKWITLFYICSTNPWKWEAQELLNQIKKDFDWFNIGGTVALNDTMRHIYKKLNIKEYC